MTHFRPSWGLFAALVLLAIATQQAAPGEPASGGAPKKWALLIGIEKYHRANRLRFTVNDVKDLSVTLRERGDYDADHVLEIVDTAPNARYQPLRASLLAEIPAFLSKAGPEDGMLVYFSGHGFRDPEGKLYLAPIDCDPNAPTSTGIGVEWFREQIASCKARTKFLVIDACHAGAEKGDDDREGVSSKDLGSPFQDLSGVVTLASSTGDEKSQIWEEKEHSLFSYWMTQGLRGHADRDGDSAVTIDELYDYVHRNVTHSAKTQFPKPQTPVRIVRTGTPGVPEVVRLKPRGLNDLLCDIADQIAWSMQERQLAKVGVLEFTNDTKLGELLGADFGLLGRYCAEQLERRLMELGREKFSVMDRRRLQKAIEEQNFGLKDLASPESLRRLNEGSGGLPAIALGTLQNRSGRIVSLQCRLLQTQRDELAGLAGGAAALNESEWAMLGRSVRVMPDDRRPELPAPGLKPRPLEDVVIDRLDQRSSGANPLLDQNFPFRIKVLARSPGSRRFVERVPVARGNELFVPLSKGEIYQVCVENNSGQLVLMRLLVDGLNTLPQRQTTKDMVVEAVNSGGGELVMAPRVNLDSARPWAIDPKHSKTITIEGFYSSLERGGKYREFVVVDSQDSLAARQQFTDQIGLITAAFYSPASQSRAIGTGAGAERRGNARERAGLDCGNLQAVVHLRYVEPEALR